MSNKEIRAQLIDRQMRDLLTHLEYGQTLTMHDREAAAKATSALILSARLEAEEAVDISRISEGPSFEDALAQLDEDT